MVRKEIDLTEVAGVATVEAVEATKETITKVTTSLGNTNQENTNQDSNTTKDMVVITTRRKTQVTEVVEAATEEAVAVEAEVVTRRSTE